MALYNELRRPIAEDKEFNKQYSLTSRLVRLKTNLAPPTVIKTTILTFLFFLAKISNKSIKYLYFLNRFLTVCFLLLANSNFLNKFIERFLIKLINYEALSENCQKLFCVIDITFP